MVERKREATDLSHQFIPEVPQQIIKSAIEDLDRDRDVFIEHVIEELRSTGNNFLAERLRSFNPLYYSSLEFGLQYALFATFTVHCIIQAFQAKKIEVPKVAPDTFESMNNGIISKYQEQLVIEEEIAEIRLSNLPMLNALEYLIGTLNPSRFISFDIGSGITHIHRSFRRQVNTDALDRMWDVKKG